MITREVATKRCKECGHITMTFPEERICDYCKKQLDARRFGKGFDVWSKDDGDHHGKYDEVEFCNWACAARYLLEIVAEDGGVEHVSFDLINFCDLGEKHDFLDLIRKGAENL